MTANSYERFYISGLLIVSMLLGRAQGFHLRRESPLFSTKSLYMGSSEYDKYTIAILGDLHLDPRFMDDHLEGRDHFLKILEDGNRPNSCVVSLGDLGESKPVFPDSSELFSGTTKCFQLSREYLDGFKVPFEVIGGNHDLEGIDEFPTDGSNLAAYLKILGKPSPNFLREISPKVLLLGLGSVLFRNAQYTSHEVFIDEKQIDWFEEVARTHPTEEGWRIFVFTHAPPMVALPLADSSRSSEPTPASRHGSA
eukprot:gene30670-40777_t